MTDLLESESECRKDDLHRISDRALGDLHNKAAEQCAKLLGCDKTLPISEARRRSAALLVELEDFAAHMRDRFFNQPKFGQPDIIKPTSDWLLESV